MINHKLITSVNGVKFFKVTNEISKSYLIRIYTGYSYRADVWTDSSGWKSLIADVTSVKDEHSFISLISRLLLDNS